MANVVRGARDSKPALIAKMWEAIFMICLQRQVLEEFGFSAR